MKERENQTNIGSGKNPVWVPDCAFSPESKFGRLWWEKVAIGSVNITPEHLGRIEEIIDRKEDKNGKES